jgi:hypothetical protein
MILAENRRLLSRDHARFGLLRGNAKSPDGPGKAYIESDADDVRVEPATSPSFRDGAKRRARNPYSLAVVMDSGLLVSLGRGMMRT